MKDQEEQILKLNIEEIRVNIYGQLTPVFVHKLLHAVGKIVGKWGAIE